MLCCGAVGGWPEREQCHLLGSWMAFSHFFYYPQANWALLVLNPRWVGLCTFQDPVGLSNEVSCEAGSFSCCFNPHRFFSVRGFEALFPCNGTLSCVIYLILQLFFLVYLHENVGWLSLLATASPALVLQPPPCHKSSASMLPVSTPPTGVDECFFFNSLVVGIPYSSGYFFCF